MDETTSLKAALDRPMLQAEFADLVGVSQPTVSELQARGILQPDQPAGVWLLAYTKHLREQAAGRGADGELARERARLAREQADRVALENATARKEMAPVSMLEFVLAKMAGEVASTLQGIVPTVKRRVPLIAPDALRIIEEIVVKARNSAAAVTLAEADRVEDDEQED